MNYSYTLIIHYSLKNFLIVDECHIILGVCFHRKYKIPYIRVYPYIKIRLNKHTLPKSPNIFKNLTYILEFQTQHHYPINLSSKAIPSEI